MVSSCAVAFLVSHGLTIFLNSGLVHPHHLDESIPTCSGF